MSGRARKEVVGFRIPIELKEKLEEEVRLRGSNMTTFVREAIECHLVESVRLRRAMADDRPTGEVKP